MDSAEAHARLIEMASGAIRTAKGDDNKAYEGFGLAMLKANDIELERELTSGYRSLALRAFLAVAFQELRAKGFYPLKPETPIQTTDYDRSMERHRSWASQHVKQMEERSRNYLNEFKVNGEPIGDCTAEIVLSQAERHERDARFMRLMASGVPPQSKIRDYVSAEEAEKRWQMARETPRYATTPDLDWAFNLMMKGIKTAEQFDEAAKRAEALMDAKPNTHDGATLDCLARAIHDHENSGRNFDFRALAELRKAEGEY